jgi:hypothetical protein
VIRKHDLSEAEGSYARFCTGGGVVTHLADRNLGICRMAERTLAKLTKTSTMASLLFLIVVATA